MMAVQVVPTLLSGDSLKTVAQVTQTEFATTSSSECIFKDFQDGDYIE